MVVGFNHLLVPLNIVSEASRWLKYGNLHSRLPFDRRLKRQFGSVKNLFN